MPNPSPELQRQMRLDLFTEIHETVRVFTLYNENTETQVRITIVRYYHENGPSYAAHYERWDDPDWVQEDYGQILNGRESEDSAIMMAINFARKAMKLDD